MNTPIENRKLMILEAIDRVQNFMDCDVLAEARGQIENSDNIKDLMDGINYALSAIDYRAPDRGHEAYVVKLYKDNRAMIVELAEEIAIKNIDALIAKAGNNNDSN